MRRRIPYTGGTINTQQFEFTPSFMYKTEDDYIIGTDAKHGTSSLNTSFPNLKHGNHDTHRPTYRKLFGKEPNSRENYLNAKWVTVWRSTDSLLRSLIKHHWREWRNGTKVGFSKFEMYLDWCFGLEHFCTDFYPNEDHSHQIYRLWQAWMVTYYNMVAIDISELSKLMTWAGGEAAHKNTDDEWRGDASEYYMSNLDNHTEVGVLDKMFKDGDSIFEEAYNKLVYKLQYHKTDWYRMQLLCDNIKVTKFEDFRKSATLGRNDVDSTSENSTKRLQESPQ